MLMLTHTWILKEFIGRSPVHDDDKLDLFTYNVSPDMLCFHQGLSADKTHSISRFRHLPQEHRKAAFVHFHLLVDDIAHHGKISDHIVTEFNPYSSGYTYIKGKPLIEPLKRFYQEIGKDVGFAEISYQSHMIIEMMFDLALHFGQANDELLSLFCRSIHYTAEKRIDEFSETMGWLLGITKETATRALQGGQNVCTLERMKLFTSMEGRVAAFMGRFGLNRQDEHSRKGIENLMNQGMDLVADYGNFLNPTIEKIKDAGFSNPL
jgi:hypothetical protein